MSDSEDIQISISDTDSEVEQQSTSSISEFDTEEDDMSISSSDSDFDEELEEPVTKRAKKGGTKKKDVQVEQRQPAAEKKTAKAVCKTTPKATSLGKNNMMHSSDLILKPRDGVSPPAVRKKPVLDTVLQPSEGPKVFKPFPTVQDPKNAFLSVEDQERRQANIEAMLSGDLTVKRHPLLPSILSVSQDTEILKRPFRSPFPNAPAVSDELRRALAARRQFIPFGSGKKFVPPKMIAPATVVQPVEKEIGLPEGVEELILWKSSDGTEQVKVDNSLTRFLRPHQREGVQFLFECVTGLREHDGYGSILADDMGLGKTLQGITLLWTLLNSGHDDLGGKPIAKRIVICCPCALVTNWENECVKWLNGRVRTLAICDSSRDEVSESLKKFTSPSNTVQVLIISYETFRIHAARFQASDTCDLLICDEAHRLKNDQTLTNKALASMHCKRRILLSGTPMQNQLQEFYSMVDFCNPGVLGTPSEFRRTYERPILAGREPDATDEERKLSKERSDQLSTFVNSFILRRTNELLSKHLPPKVIQLVCCKMTPMQLDLYSHFVHSRKVTSLLTKVSGQVLSAITTVRKLMNHPKLIYDLVTESKKNGRSATTGFESCKDLLQPSMFESVRGALPKGWEEFSGKFAVAARMLNLLRRNTKDRVVIVSNFTQTLDLFTQLCRENKYPFVRLDGSISITKREKMVKKFNDPKEDQFIFLLSSKAGGCGLNLIGGNRLIMFDMSWNPADDKQAAARVWRDGQQKRVYVYKFMTTGTIEEKIFQRQLNKEGLQSVVDSNTGDGAQAEANFMSCEQLRDLFTYNPDTISTTYEHIVRAKQPDDAFEDIQDGEYINIKQKGHPKEDELACWGLHSDPITVPDECMQLCAKNDVSFIFSCQVDGRYVPESSPILKKPVQDPKIGQVLSSHKSNVPIPSKHKLQSIIADSEDDCDFEI